MRLDKFLSNLNYGSRTDIKKYCKDGRVTVNNKVITDSAFQIDYKKDIIAFDGEEVFYDDDFTIMINKPVGYICSNIDEDYPSLLNILPDDIKRLDLNFAGRLDFDTEGLVIATNNGTLLHQIITPKNDIKKTYLVKVDKPIKDLSILEKPMAILDGKNEPYITKPAKAEKIDEYSFYLTISEGKFHQVKRMVEKASSNVIYLKRVKIGNLELNDLELGKFTKLSQEEISKLLQI